MRIWGIGLRGGGTAIRACCFLGSSQGHLTRGVASGHKGRGGTLTTERTRTMSFSERCERLAVKAGQEAYDRARAAGLGHREAHCVAAVSFTTSSSVVTPFFTLNM